MSVSHLIRYLVIAEISVLIVTMFISANNPIPPGIAGYIDHSPEGYALDSKPLFVLCITFMAGILISWIGLLCQWKPSRWIYISAHLLSVILTPFLGYTFKMPIVATLSEVSHMITGALIFLLLIPNPVKLALENKTLHPTADRG